MFGLEIKDSSSQPIFDMTHIYEKATKEYADSSISIYLAKYV